MKSKVECLLQVWKVSWLGQTQVIKIGKYIFQCDVQHQWIAQRQVGPVSIYNVLWRGGVSCSMSVAWYSCEGSTLVKVSLIQAGNVAIWPHDQTQTQTQTYFIWSIIKYYRILYILQFGSGRPPLWSLMCRCRGGHPGIDIVYNF